MKPAAPHDPPPHWTEALRRGLRDRATAVLFALGLGTGVPLGWAWYNLPTWSGHRASAPGFVMNIDAFLDLLTGMSSIYLLGLLLAPFLDRWPAPLFRRLGRRRSWMAATLAFALVLTLVFTALAATLSPDAAAPVMAVYGLIAFAAAAILVVAVHAYRIELRPGRDQAIAFGALYLGAWIGKFAALFAGAGAALSLPYAASCALLLALALWAVIRHAEPVDEIIAPQAFAHVPAGIPTVLVPLEAAARTLVRPWGAFFERHRGASAFLLIAIACSAVAGSVASYLARQGYLFETEMAGNRDAIARIQDGMRWVGYLGYPAAIAGFATAVVVALSHSPTRAFCFLQKAFGAFFILFTLCYLASGATPTTAAILALALTALDPLATIIVGVVLARLTVRPHTAGQIMILLFFAYTFSLPAWIYARFAGEIGIPGIVILGIVFALAAFLFMQAASRVAPRRRPAAQRAQPSS